MIYPANGTIKVDEIRAPLAEGTSMPMSRT